MEREWPGSITYLALKQTTLHPPTLTGLAPPQQSSQDARLGIVPRKDVGDGHAHLDGPTVPLTGDVHQAGLGFNDDVVPRILGVGTGGAVSCMYEYLALAQIPRTVEALEQQGQSRDGR